MDEKRAKKLLDFGYAEKQKEAQDRKGEQKMTRCRIPMDIQLFADPAPGGGYKDHHRNTLGYNSGNYSN